MTCTLVIGTQWGDEGKGRIVDNLSEDVDLVARYQGGANAGHTIVVGDTTYKLHYIPGGVVRGKPVVLGNCMVIEPDGLREEIESLKKLGLNPDITISGKAHVITKRHLEEDSKGSGVGSTRRGIGPCYTSKTSRNGIRWEDYAKDFTEWRDYIGDASLKVNECLDSGGNVLIEGAQGTMLDIDHGTYPYVTSSSTCAGGACIGLGISPKRIDKIIGVVKAYTTRVGLGPFPTELGNEAQLNEEGTWEEIEPFYDEQVKESLEKANQGDEYYQGKYLRLKGYEYGTTTGRSRRCGWLDGLIVKYADRINGLDEIALTKLDVLSGLEELRVCGLYEGGISDLPSNLQGHKPLYGRSMPGWSEDIGSVKEFEKLPENTTRYVALIEAYCKKPITMIGVGPRRDQIIMK